MSDDDVKGIRCWCPQCFKDCRNPIVVTVRQDRKNGDGIQEYCPQCPETKDSYFGIGGNLVEIDSYRASQFLLAVWEELRLMQEVGKDSLKEICKVFDDINCRL